MGKEMISILLQPNEKIIYTYAGLEGPPPNYSQVENLHYAQFEEDMTLTSISYTVAIVFSTGNTTYEVDDLGKINYKYENRVAPVEEIFKAIGTRSKISPTNDHYRFIGTISISGVGTCTAYFDDVYVLRKPKASASSLLLLDE